MSKFPSDSSEKRKNVYLRNPDLWITLQAAIDNGVIKARGVSERLEHLIRADLRKQLPKLRKAGVQIPEAVLR